MKTIYKYEIAWRPGPAARELPLPIGRRFLAFERQDGALRVWYYVDTAAAIERVKFLIVGTGCNLEGRFGPHAADWAYRGTVVMPSGNVWHLFECAAHAAAGPGAGPAQSTIKNPQFEIE